MAAAIEAHFSIATVLHDESLARSDPEERAFVQDSIDTHLVDFGRRGSALRVDGTSIDTA
jgi:hypothetical protein